MDNTILDLNKIEDNLETSLVGRKVLVYKSTSSTNDVAWEYARNRTNSGLAIFAEHQSKGRGRRGNTWLSSPGQSLLCSMLVMDTGCPAEFMAITSAVAAAEAISSTAPVNAKIKWPNDIMVNSKKIAGLLLESHSSPKGNDYVIGIGINCSQQPQFFDNPELLMPATSLEIESGTEIDRNDLARNLLRSFDRWIKTATQNTDSVIKHWTHLSSQLGMNITVRYMDQEYTGTCIGVDPAAGLILQMDKGGIRMFEAAKTTIVKHR